VPATRAGLFSKRLRTHHRDDEFASITLEQAVHTLPQLSSLPDTTGGLAPWQVRRLTAYIDDNLDATLRTCQLAATLGLSVSHFTRAFKQSVGVSPRVYVVRRRLAAACEAMLATDEPLTTIAHTHGFCDQSHFTRAFHTAIGAAPQAWRRSQGCGHFLSHET
jgi:AraC family transcriptional regulator